MSDVSEPTQPGGEAAAPPEPPGSTPDDSADQGPVEGVIAPAASAHGRDSNGSQTGAGAGPEPTDEAGEAEHDTGLDSEGADADPAWEPRDHDLIPLLPRGTALFDGMPAEAIFLEALCPTIGNGAIVVRRPDAVGVILVQEGALFEKYAFREHTRLIGDGALAEIKAWPEAAVSAYRFDPLIVAVAPSLLRGDPLYEDLHLNWTDWDGLLADLCTRDGSYVVELDTPLGRGVTCILDGRQVATYTDQHPEFGDESLLTPLAATRRGTIWVRREPSIADEATAERVAWENIPVAELPAGAEAWQPPAPAPAWTGGGEAPAWQPGQSAAAQEWAQPLGEPTAPPGQPPAERPIWPPVDAGGASAGGPPTQSSPVAAYQPWAETRHPGEGRGQSGPPRPTPFRDFFRSSAPMAEPQSPLASLAPDLKLIARNRLHRSAARVETMIDEAALENRPLDEVLAEIRGLVIRGVMQSTLDEVVDEMSSRARRPLA